MQTSIYLIFLCKGDASTPFQICSKKDLVKWEAKLRPLTPSEESSSAAQVLDAGLMMQMQAQQLRDDWYKLRRSTGSTLSSGDLRCNQHPLTFTIGP